MGYGWAIFLFFSIFIFVCFCFSKGLNFFFFYVVLIDASIIGGDARFELLVATRSLIVAIVTMRQRYLQYICVICYLYFHFFSFNRLQIYIFFSYLGIFFLSLSFLLEWWPSCFLFFIFIFLPLCVCVAGNIGKRSLFWSGIYLFGFLWFIWACWAASLSIFDPDVCYFPFLWIIRAC